MSSKRASLLSLLQNFWKRGYFCGCTNHKIVFNIYRKFDFEQHILYTIMTKTGKLSAGEMLLVARVGK